MKKTLLKVGYSLGIIAMLSSCELDQISPADLADASATLEENTNTEMGVIKVFENVNNYGFGSGSAKSATGIGTEPTVTWSGLTMTIDFTSVPGATGKIIVAFSGVPGYTPGVKATIVFDNYSNDGSSLEGSMEMAVEQFIPAVKAKFTLETIGNITVSESGNSYLWACDQIFDWNNGLNTLLDGSDDSFVLNGTSVQTLDTVVNNMTLTDIVYASECKFLMDGELVILKDAGSPDEFQVTCDFGVDANGEDKGLCDGNVLMTAGGLTLSIDLE